MEMIMITSSAVGQVELYNTLSTTFLVIGIIFLILAVVLFFLFRVANILAVKTGRAQRRTIKEMESINAETGRLHSRVRRNDAAGGQPRKEMWNTTQLDADDVASVSSGYSAVDEGNNNTTLLNMGNNDTTVLNAVAIGMNDTRALGEEVEVQIGKFVIVREIVMIHTEEVV